MAATLPIGHWSWHERWLYPDQIYDQPDRPLQYVYAQQLRQQQIERDQHQASQIERLKQTIAGTIKKNGGAQTQRTHSRQQSQQQYQPQPPSQPSTFSSTTAAATQQQPPNFSLNLKPLLSSTEEHKEQHLQPLPSNNPQATYNQRFPALPRRYRDGTFRRTTSEYCYTYRDPARIATELGGHSVPAATSNETEANGTGNGFTPGTRPPPRERGRMNAPKDFLHHHFSAHYDETPEETARVRPEQHSFRLWGRINNAHCVVPYETESQRAFDPSLLHRDPLERTHFMRVEQKEYKDALAVAKKVGVIRGAGGYVNTGRK